jgi:hypothetical protein
MRFSELERPLQYVLHSAVFTNYTEYDRGNVIICILLMCLFFVPFPPFTLGCSPMQNKNMKSEFHDETVIDSVLTVLIIIRLILIILNYHTGVAAWHFPIPFERPWYQPLLSY